MRCGSNVNAQLIVDTLLTCKLNLHRSICDSSTARLMRSSGSILAKRVLRVHNTSAYALNRSSCFRHHLLSIRSGAYIGTMSRHTVQRDDVVTNGQRQPQYNISKCTSSQGDLNNTTSMRQTDEIDANPEFAYHSLAISTEEDEPDTRTQYRPFLLDTAIAAEDWVAKLELATVTEMAQRDIATTGERLKILVLYGSLRHR